MATSPYEIVNIEMSAIITNTLSGMGLMSDLSYYVMLRATGNDSGSEPTISGESFSLLGSPTSAGGSFAWKSIGYAFTYGVRIGSTTVADSKVTKNKDGSKTLTKRYFVTIIADWDYVCLGHYSGSTEVQSFYMQLSHTRPAE